MNSPVEEEEARPVGWKYSVATDAEECDSRAPSLLSLCDEDLFEAVEEFDGVLVKDGRVRSIDCDARRDRLAIFAGCLALCSVFRVF